MAHYARFEGHYHLDADGSGPAADWDYYRVVPAVHFESHRGPGLLTEYVAVINGLLWPVNGYGALVGTTALMASYAGRTVEERFRMLGRPLKESDR